ncbi:MAG: ABC transporter permease [Thaumarchaeota archaeon]|nr:ABC transporter permease [Nitrososphaerota archaeon]
MGLKAYVATRAILTVPMLVILTTIVFLIVRVLPGDPVLLHFGKQVNPQAVEQVRHILGMDKPIHLQYLDYMAGLLRGNLGIAFSNYQPVSEQIFSAFPATLELTLYSIIVAVLVGVLLGARASSKYASVGDTSIRAFGIVSYAIPVFFLGLILQYLFAIYPNELGHSLLPATGRISAGDAPQGGEFFGVHLQTGLYTVDALLGGSLSQFLDAARHLVLPSLTLGIALSGVFIRITRSNMVDVLGQDFVTAARGRGLKERTVLYSYGLRNALLPILTVLGLQFAALLGGAILTETTFAWGGLGTYLYRSIEGYDYTAIQGAVIFFGLLVALVSLVIDVLYAYLDPRIKY